MRHALVLALVLIGCDDDLAGEVVPPKPSCGREDVLALMTCPGGYGWVAQWSRPDAMGTTRGYFALDEDPGEPWSFEGEYCTPGSGTTLSAVGDAAAGWSCHGDECQSYRYRVTDGEAVETHSVSCNNDNGTVFLIRVTSQAGGEAATHYFEWPYGGPGEDVTSTYALPPG